MVFLYCWSSIRLDCLSHTHLHVCVCSLLGPFTHRQVWDPGTAWHCMMDELSDLQTNPPIGGVCVRSLSPHQHLIQNAKPPPQPISLHTLSSRPPESHSAGGPGEVMPRAGHLWGVDICLLSQKHTVALTRSGFCSFRFLSFRFSELLEERAVSDTASKNRIFVYLCQYSCQWAKHDRILECCLKDTVKVNCLYSEQTAKKFLPQCSHASDAWTGLRLWVWLMCAH